MTNPEEGSGNGGADPNVSAAQSPEATSSSKEDWQIQRDASKHLADAAFRSGDYKSAIESYTAALSLDPDFAVCLSNRSAAYLKNNEKSKALHDAQECVRLGTMKSKGFSRLAAALQSLGRHEQALLNWRKVVKEDPNNAAAQKGVDDCQKEVDKLKEEKDREEAEAKNKEEEEKAAAAEEPKDDGDSLLDDFFDDVDTAASQVAKEKEMAFAAATKQIPTNAIKNSKKDLGTAESQIERLLQTNYKWKNFNPFYVLDISHTASKDEISKRYKALSLLLHPDKNTTEHENAQLAYDEVLKAKQSLDDDNKANHCRQLVEQGMAIGQSEWEQKQRETKVRATADNATGDDTLESFQRKAVLKIFAEVEYKRRDVEKRERDYDVREKQKEEEEEQKARNERKFDKNWKQDERVEKRIGNWRQFQVKKKNKH